MANQSRRKKALIKTLHLYNGNYGGVIQNYALQQVLRGLGIDSWTDVTKPGGLANHVWHAFKPLTTRYAPARMMPLSLAGYIIDSELTAFIDEEINTVKIGPSQRSIQKDARVFDIFITGSDQIWRNDYTDVAANLFKSFEKINAPKIAYAGSFGTSSMAGYPPELKSRSRALAQKLTAVSVRESAAVQLCESEWGVQATHVLDPAMLLDRAAYNALIPESASQATPKSYVFDYTLDSSVASQEFTERVASRVRSEVWRGMPPVPRSFAEVKRSPATFVKPSMREWLRGFRDAEFVVTDSFHGTIFSILFERPFVSVLNNSRGAERFYSLLALFGLEDRLVTEREFPRGLTVAPDWSLVRERLQVERTASLEFLRSSIGV